MQHIQAPLHTERTDSTPNTDTTRMDSMDPAGCARSCTFSPRARVLHTILSQKSERHLFDVASVCVDCGTQISEGKTCDISAEEGWEVDTGDFQSCCDLCALDPRCRFFTTTTSHVCYLYSSCASEKECSPWIKAATFELSEGFSVYCTLLQYLCSLSFLNFRFVQNSH